MCACAQDELADQMEKTKKVENFRSGGGREERRQYAKNILLKMVMIVRVLFAISEDAGFKTTSISTIGQFSSKRVDNMRQTVLGSTRAVVVREMLIAVNSTNHQHSAATRCG